ncbi:MAG: serine O-acetyltransferase [Pseudomonadota bacterium]|jgi:serine O-acetyltransferase
MTLAVVQSSDAIWQSLVREAEDAAAADGLLARSLETAIFQRAGLADAIAHQIGRRLADGGDTDRLFARAARDAFTTDPELARAASLDLQSVILRDPASPRLLPVLTMQKGFVALEAWRVSNWLWRQDRKDQALLAQSAISRMLQVSIHPSATIGASVFLDHATGIVVSALAEISDEVTILQNVTVGRQDGGASPKIGRGVLLSAGSTVIGAVTIGDFAKIGANSLVTENVPPGCTAVGIPARLVNCSDA